MFVSRTVKTSEGFSYSRLDSELFFLQKGENELNGHNYEVG
jgi:hypothetical protein